MHKKHQKLKENLSKSQEVYNRRPLIKGSIIATIIAITPYLFTLHESVPSTQVWYAFLFSYDSKNWGDANLVFWIFTSKIIPLLLLFIWIFTCRHWWFHAILVPIAMYIYQIFDLFFEDQSLDKFQLIYMIPVMAIVIPSIYLIRARIFNKINNANKSLEELEEEFKITPKGFWRKIRKYI